MAKINTLTVEGNKKEGYTVTAMTDDGTVLDIKEGFEFATAEAYNRSAVEWETAQDDIKNLHLRLDGLSAENSQLSDINTDMTEENNALRVALGQYKQELAAKPADVRAPLLHREYQGIPVPRTVDKLAPLDALASAPAMDEPADPALVDPDAPARPPGPGELVKVHVTDEELEHRLPDNKGQYGSTTIEQGKVFKVSDCVVHVTDDYAGHAYRDKNNDGFGTGVDADGRPTDEI